MEPAAKGQRHTGAEVYLVAPDIARKLRSNSRLLVLIAGGAMVLAACAPGSTTMRPDGAAGAQPPPQRTKTLIIDNRKENTAGVAVFSTNNGWQMQTAWTFHAGLTAYDAQGTCSHARRAKCRRSPMVIGR